MKLRRVYDGRCRSGQLALDGPVIAGSVKADPATLALRTEINYAPGRDRTLKLLTTDEFERAMRWLCIEIAKAEREIALSRSASPQLSFKN